MLRWAAVLAWVEPLGVKSCDLRKMVRAGVLRQIVLHKGGRPYYSTKQIHAIIVAPLEAVEKQISS